MLLACVRCFVVFPREVADLPMVINSIQFSCGRAEAGRLTIYFNLEVGTACGGILHQSRHAMCDRAIVHQVQGICRYVQMHQVAWVAPPAPQKSSGLRAPRWHQLVLRYVQIYRSPAQRGTNAKRIIAPDGPKPQLLKLASVPRWCSSQLLRSHEWAVPTEAQRLK